MTIDLASVVAFTQGYRREPRYSATRFLRAFAVFLLISTTIDRANAGLVNGSFETGDFSSWTRESFINYAGGPTIGGPNYETFLTAKANAISSIDTNHVVMQQVHSFVNPVTPIGSRILPTDGQYLAFVSDARSYGVGTLTGSSISQTFTVSPNDASLNFDVRVLNSDRLVNFSLYDDFAGVSLSRGSTILAQFNLDLDPNSSANMHVIAGATVGGFLNSTPWESVGFDLSAYAGQQVTLTAYALNWRDNRDETRLLLDNVTIQPHAITTPGPSSFILIVTGGIFALGNAWNLHRVINVIRPSFIPDPGKAPSASRGFRRRAFFRGRQGKGVRACS